MKLPLALTFIILAAGSFWGVHETRVLTKLREKHRMVVQEAAALGVSTDASKADTVTKASKRQREDTTRKAKDFANTLVNFVKEMKEMEKSGAQPDAEMQKRIMEMVDGMLSLNGEELKIVISEIRGRADLDDETREEMIGFSIMMLAQQHPQTALAIFTESSDLFDQNGMSSHVLSSALSQWAKDQPLAALEWIKKNSEKHPDLIKDDAKTAVITGASATDFGLAFQLAGELKLSVTDGSILGKIAANADTPERQAEFLAALRKQASQTTDQGQANQLLKTGLLSLFSKISGTGYEKATAWIQSANLSAEETGGLAENLRYHTTKADTGKWLEWVSTQGLDSDKSNRNTKNLVSEWTRNDYKAAGEWLATSPAGPMKESATMAYLETVAPYDPDVAAQWAQTLTGDKKVASMKSIFEALKQKDEAAAKEFAKKHGISDE